MTSQLNTHYEESSQALDNKALEERIANEDEDRQVEQDMIDKGIDKQMEQDQIERNIDKQMELDFNTIQEGKQQEPNTQELIDNMSLGMADSQLGTTMDIGTNFGTQVEPEEGLAEFGQIHEPNIDECLDAMDDMSDGACSQHSDKFDKDDSDYEVSTHT